MTSPTFVDSHCHLDFPELSCQLDAVLAAMAAAGVSHALTIGVKMEAWDQVLSIAARFPHIFASVGVHPDEADVAEPTVEELVAAAAAGKVVAIGETGLDYYRRSDDDFKRMQQARFVNHIHAARITGKPLVIHTRAASADTLSLLKSEGAREVSGVMHCFTESVEVAKAALDLGFYISFSGILTFKNAEELRATAVAVPLEYTLIETDSPYLAPAPHRGKTNTPAFVPLVAQQLAALKNRPLEEVASLTSQNFFNLFRAARVEASD